VAVYPPSAQAATMRERLVASTPGREGAPNVDLVSSERLDRASHYVLIHTQHRATNKALQIDAIDLDHTIDLLQTARRFLHQRRIATSPTREP
jgi:hypothetical protein